MNDYNNLFVYLAYLVYLFVYIIRPHEIFTATYISAINKIEKYISESVKLLARGRRVPRDHRGSPSGKGVEAIEEKIRLVLAIVQLTLAIIELTRVLYALLS